MLHSPNSDEFRDSTELFERETSAAGVSPPYSAEDILEILWRASVSGVAPTLMNPLPDAVALLHQRMSRDDAADWPGAGKHIENGARLQATGDSQGALLAFGAAYASIAPGTACLLQIASIYLASGDYQRAELWLRRKSGEAGGGSDPDTLLHLAHALWGSGKVDEALAVCDRLIARHPHHVPGIDTAALMHTEKGDPRKALDACIALLAALPEHDQNVPISLARRTVLAAVKLGVELPRAVIDRISALAAASRDDELFTLLRRIEIHDAARKNWLSLFAPLPDSFPAEALTPIETAMLKELLDIERSAPVVGIKSIADLEPQDAPRQEPSAADRLERALKASDLSSSGILATQLAIVEAGEVTLLSPYGEVVSSSSSIVLNYHPARREYGSVIAFYFDGDRPLFVFFATEDSWPLAWYDPVAHQLICYDNVIAEFTAYLQDRVRELKLCCLADPDATHRYLAAAASRKGRPPTLLAGMLDYLSTHLFADLQGLKRFVEHLPSSAISDLIVAAPEPFGPVDAILPELASVSIIRDLPQNAVALNHRLWEENRMLARITGCMVEQPLADRLLARAEQLADQTWRRAVDDLRANPGPVLFIALRAHNRRWLADGAVIAGVLNRLHARFPGLGVILDGHGLGGTPPSPSLVDRENAMIADIIASLDPGIGRLVAAGRTILDSVYAAGASTAHLSAQGTSAAKPVLIAGLPGVVIGSRQFGWNVTAFRSPSPYTLTLSEMSVDAEVNNLQSDFALNPEVVFDALVDVITSAHSSPA